MHLHHATLEFKLILFDRSGVNTLPSKGFSFWIYKDIIMLSMSDGLIYIINTLPYSMYVEMVIFFERNRWMYEPNINGK